MPYIEVADLAEAESFKTRVKVAIVRAAANIIHEDGANFSQERADKRNALARAILADPATQATMFVWPVVSNTTIAANGLATSDGDLDYQVSVVFDAMAGVTNSEM